jgi:mannose/fructose/N-acetylgalactosamine-specific phosphotransferase system component IID
MKEKLSKLIDVKSIVTLVLTGLFVYLAVTGNITGEQFIVIFTTIIAFYFGTQHAKKAGE